MIDSHTFQTQTPTFKMLQDPPYSLTSDGVGSPHTPSHLMQSAPPNKQLLKRPVDLVVATAPKGITDDLVGMYKKILALNNC